MKKLVVASNNCNKIREIKQMLSKYPIEILSMKDMNLNVDILEDGETFSENAYKKASTIYHMLQDKCMVLADDSGLMVKGLDGAPGVHSARFAGEHGNDKKNNEKLLKLLEGMKPQDREAKFVCALVLIVDSKRTFKVEGEVKGIICDEERGNNKFGYDPLFYVAEYHKTFGELPYEIKNSISHRANALKKLEEQMRDIMEEV